MPSWKRITLVSFVLIGGIMSFAYWSQYQFNSALSDLETTLTANMLLVFPSPEEDVELASTSLEISDSLEISEALATSTNLELSFNFPKKGDKVYIGCTYPISWQSPTTISSLETALVDAGTREVVGPIASGLAKENTIERDLQNLKWKVGVVWSGAYYIKVSKINGVESEFRSIVFEINEMSKNISTSEKENICKGSGGSF